MLNNIILMGRLTTDPELKSTQTGVSVCSFTIAVDRDFPQGGEKQTDFIDIVTWRSMAEFVSRYFFKGAMIVVQGSLQSRKWKDKNDNNRISWEVQAANVWFGGSKMQTDDDPDDPPDDPPREKHPTATTRRGRKKPHSDLPEEEFKPMDDGDLPF